MAAINQIYAIINNANKMTWGKKALDIVDTSSLVAWGNHVQNSSDSGSLDVWTGALVDQVAKIAFYAKGLQGDSLGIERDEHEFGAIRIKYRMKPVDVEKNTEYELGNESFDPFAVKTPTVNMQMFNNYGTYECVVTVTDKQIFTAFTSEAQMVNFYSMIYTQLENAMIRSENSWDRLALASFIGEKLNLQKTQSGKIHAINILKLYNDTFSKNLTTDTMYTDGDFLRFFSSKMLEFKKQFSIETDVFNGSDGYVEQTPESDLKVFVHQAIDSRLAAYLYSNTYHDEMVKIDSYKVIPYWQAIKADGKPFDNKATTKISVQLDSDGETIIEQGGVLAVMMDKDCVSSYYSRPNSETWRIPTKGYQNYRAITKEYAIDVYCNGLVIYAEDYDDETLLKEITWPEITLTPDFESTTTTYTGTSDIETTGLEIEAYNKEAKITVKKGSTKITQEATGEYEIAMTEGENKVTVDVEHGGFKTTYTFTITAASPEVSPEA